jgi:glucokinase
MNGVRLAPPLCVGLDIGGSKVLAVAVDENGRVVGQLRLNSEPGSDGVIAVAVEAVARLAERLDIAVSELGAIGVGVPGLVDSERGFVAHAVNLGVGSEGLALAQHLHRHTGLKVAVENDVNAAALGAARTLGLNGADLAYLSVGTGLAAGLVLNGQLRRGHRSAAGEIGHVPVDPNGPLCTCGQRGCLETFASGRALALAWPVPSYHSESEPGIGAARSLFLAASNGEPDAIGVRDAFASHLAEAVRLLVLAVDVDTVVLGGGVAAVGEELLTALASALATQGAGSAFLRSLDLPSRVTMIASEVPVAAIGAALIAHDPAAS